MNRANNLGPRMLNKLILAAFVCFTLVQIIFPLQHHATPLGRWNNLLAIAGFIFSVPRIFPSLAENLFYGAFSFLLRVKLWVPVILCVLLAASLGLDLLLPNSQTGANSGQTSSTSGTNPGQTSSSPGTTIVQATSVAGTNPGQTSSSVSATPTVQPTLSVSGVPVLSDAMASPIPTDRWDEVNQPSTKCSFLNGGYDIRVLPQHIEICKTEDASTNLSNFIYEITMTMVQGSGAAGIVFRDESISSASTNLSQQPPMTDLLLFDQEGNYSLAVMSHNGRPAMTKTGVCSNFLPGLNHPNQIDVQVKGQTIDIFVNGIYLTSTQDDQLQSGQMGVMLMAGDAISEATYSNFALWKL